MKASGPLQLIVDSFGALFSPALGMERTAARRGGGSGATRPLAGGLGYAQLECAACCLQVPGKSDEASPSVLSGTKENTPVSHLSADFRPDGATVYT
jgi:hypothetical protein